MNIDPRAASQILQSQLQPWYQALSDPKNAQESVLERLLCDYAKTKYGKNHGASSIFGIIPPLSGITLNS